MWISLLFYITLANEQINCTASRYNQLREMTAEDAKEFDEGFALVANIASRAKRIINMLDELKGVNIGAPVDLFQHAMETAHFAFEEGEPEDVVVAALLHDLGEVIIPSSHGEYAASILRPHLTPRVTWCLEHHEVFQFAHYAHAYGILDPSKPKRELGATDEQFDFCERFTEYDQKAFNSELYISKSRQELYISMVQNVLRRPAYWWLPLSHGADSMSIGKKKLLTAYPDYNPAHVQLPPTNVIPKIFNATSLDPTSIMQALSSDGIAIIENMENIGTKESIWDLSAAIFETKTFTKAPFWELGKMTHGAHFVHFENEAAQNLDHISEGLGFLPPHTDGTYLPIPPRIKVLGTVSYEGKLCRNIFIDSHASISKLPAADIDKLLKFPVDVSITYQDRFMQHSSPVLSLDGDGQPMVRWNPHDAKHIPPELLETYEKLSDAMQNSAFELEMIPGTMVLIDNHRWLHGRGPIESKYRHMSTVDISDLAYRSRQRKLKISS